MTSIAWRCLAMFVTALVLAVLLLAAGDPAGLLLAVLPALLCVGLHLVHGHGDPDDAGLEAAQDAAHARWE